MTDTATDYTETATETAPSWTRDPAKEARERYRPLWPDEAEAFDDDKRTALRGAKRTTDPRPHAGYVTARSYCDFPECDHAVHRRFECVLCGLGKVIGVGATDSKYSQIRFSCPACRKLTYHNPAGGRRRYLTLHTSARP